MSRSRDNAFAVCDFTDKKRRIEEYCNYMMDRVNHMFEYEGLPENLSQRSMEQRLMRTGQLCLAYINEDEILNPEGVKPMEAGVYAFYSTPGGVFDLNDEPTQMVIAHPRLKQSKTLTIGVDCVLLRNDTYCMGLMPLFERYATLLVENDITINMAEIASRMPSLIVAGDDSSKQSAEMMITKLKNGEFAVVMDDVIDDIFKLQTLPYASQANNTITNLIELEQYIKASWFNEMGLSANYNMKREAINSSEAQLGQDSLIPLIDDMLHRRQEAWELANKLFGTTVSVDYHRPWIQLEEIEEPLDEETATPDEMEQGEEEPESSNEESPAEEKEESDEIKESD